MAIGICIRSIVAFLSIARSPDEKQFIALDSRRRHPPVFLKTGGAFSDPGERFRTFSADQRS